MHAEPGKLELFLDVHPDDATTGQHVHLWVSPILRVASSLIYGRTERETRLFHRFPREGFIAIPLILLPVAVMSSVFFISGSAVTTLGSAAATPPSTSGQVVASFMQSRINGQSASIDSCAYVCSLPNAGQLSMDIFEGSIQP